MSTLVYAPYKKSAIHKLSTVRAMPIIAGAMPIISDAMKQDQHWNENVLTISYKSLNTSQLCLSKHVE